MIQIYQINNTDQIFLAKTLLLIEKTNHFIGKSSTLLSYSHFNSIPSKSHKTKNLAEYICIFTLLKISTKSIEYE